MEGRLSPYVMLHDAYAASVIRSGGGRVPDAVRRAALLREKPEPTKIEMWTPDQLRTTPLARCIAPHPGNETANYPPPG